jgi:outer membrane biosynthesis protein TonB
MNKSALLPLLAALTALSASACLKGDAKTPADLPALMVPPPPPRTVVPATIEPEEPVPPPPVPASSTAPPPKPDNPPPAARTTPPPAAPPPTPPSSSSAETPTVQKAAESAKMKELEGKVKESLNETDRLFEKLDPAQLSREAQAQLALARSHARGARDALGISNILLADELARKALTLARQLAK